MIGIVFSKVLHIIGSNESTHRVTEEAERLHTEIFFEVMNNGIEIFAEVAEVLYPRTFPATAAVASYVVDSNIEVLREEL